MDGSTEARFRPAPAEASGDGFARATAKVKAFLTKHIGSELRQLEHPTGRNPFTREILGQTPADRVKTHVTPSRYRNRNPTCCYRPWG